MSVRIRGQPGQHVLVGTGIITIERGSENLVGIILAEIQQLIMSYAPKIIHVDLKSTHLKVSSQSYILIGSNSRLFRMVGQISK